MTEQQLLALVDWIKAEIDVKIENAFHRDDLTESITEIECRKHLYYAFGIGGGDE